MSIAIMSLVWNIKLSDSEKIVLLAIADCANDEGMAWPSMATIARKCSKGERTCQASIKSLVDKGHLSRNEISGRGCHYTVHPRSDCTPAATAPPQRLTPTPAAAAPKPSRTIVISEVRTSSITRASKKPSRKKSPLYEIPDDWVPVQFGPDTQCRKVIDGWPPGELERQIEHFSAHHRKKADRFANWQDAWKTWVLNARNFGNERGMARNGGVDSERERGRERIRREISELDAQIAAERQAPLSH